MNKKLIALSVAGVLATATGIIYAAGQPVTHTFSANTVAKASEVNANFQELADRIDALQTANTFDYNDYETPETVTKKTFAVEIYGTGADYNTETREISSTVVGDTETKQTIRKRYQNGINGTQVHHQVLKHTKTSSKTVFTGRDVYNSSGANIRTETISPGITQQTSNMVMGQAWADGFAVQYDDKIGSEDHTSYGVQSSFVSGTDILTVLGNANVPCIKIHVNRQSEDMGTFQQINWQCKNYGLAKQIEVRNNYSLISTLTAMN